MRPTNEKACFRLALLLATVFVPNACAPDGAVGPVGPSGSGLVVDAGRPDVPFTRGFVGKPFAGTLAVAQPDGHIWTMTPAGSHFTKLAAGHGPSWNPDGTKIAFWRTKQAPSGGIYVMDAGGGNVTQVVPDGYDPTWSPDGRQIAFGCGGICIVNADGSGRTQLTVSPYTSTDRPHCVQDSDPAWSPNGSTIAFMRWHAERCWDDILVFMMFPFDFWAEIWLIEADGSNPRPLIGGGLPRTYAGWPAWSPNGSQLAFYYLTEDGESIAVANADGSALRTVAYRNTVDWVHPLGGPDWSPDGKQIVLGSAGTWGFARPSQTIDATTMPRARVMAPGFAIWSWSRK